MVRPEQILKDLSKLWIDLGHEQQHDAGHGAEPGAGVLRACAMTLVTIADETEDPGNVGETVALLMKEHPSRSIVIRLRAGDEAGLESRVFAQCWMPFGQRRQICCEQVEITASLSSLDDVPGVVLPLTVADLPVILWNRSPRLFTTPAFPRVAAMVDKLIVDTGAFPNFAEALKLIDGQITNGRLMADLAWTRTTRWRETVSQVFGNRDSLEALPRYTEAAVEFGGSSPAGEAVYLAAWLQNGLASVGSKVRVKLTPADGPVITAVTLGGIAGANVSIRSDASGSVEISASRLDSRTIFPANTDHLALQEELSITVRDASFEAALKTANSFV